MTGNLYDKRRSI